MKEQRIFKLVNDLFYDVVENDKVREQKEELRIHLTERVNDYMTEGLSFEDALIAAKNGLGDLDELISGFERKRVVVVDDLGDDYGVNIQLRVSRPFAKLVPLSPFIYIILGLAQSHWYPEQWAGNWWAWGWIIIPVSAILFSSDALSPPSLKKKKKRNKKMSADLDMVINTSTVHETSLSN